MEGMGFLLGAEGDWTKVGRLTSSAQRLRKSFLIQRANKHPSTIKKIFPKAPTFHPTPTPAFFLHWILFKIFIYFLLKNIYCFDCAESLLLHGLFFSCREWGLLFICGVQASHCGGFSCFGAQALGCMGFNSCGSWVLEHRFSSCGPLA